MLQASLHICSPAVGLWLSTAQLFHASLQNDVEKCKWKGVGHLGEERTWLNIHITARGVALCGTGDIRPLGGWTWRNSSTKQAATSEGHTFGSTLITLNEWIED